LTSVTINFAKNKSLGLIEENNEVVELLAVDTGWYDVSGTHIPTNINYLVGDAPDANSYHNFSVFDLSSLSMPVQSATLRLFNGESPPNTEDGYQSADPTETYALFEVSTDIGVLTSGAGGVAAYGDLADGTFFGSVSVSAADNGEFVEVELNSDGIAALNGAGGALFGFGGNITTIDNPAAPDALFWFSHESPDVRLSVKLIPEPTAMGFFALVAIGIAGIVRGKR